MRIIYLLLAALVICACTDDYIYHDLRDIDKGAWVVGDSVSFTLQPPDTVTDYSLILLMHHSDAYPYQNLYVRTRTLFPDGRQVDGRTSLQLADPSGGWYGRCSSGNCKVRIDLQQRLRFDQIGEHLIIFTPHMRMDTIHGIDKIGIALEPWSDISE